MGLESFSTGGSTSTQTTSRQSQSQSQSSSSDDTEPFKVVSGDKDRKKVFRTEEEWEETVAFLQEQMGLSADEVLNKRPSERYELLHQAILKVGEDENVPFHPTDQCVVCNEQFTFPNKWNFTRIKGEAVCNEHKIGEVVEAIREVSIIGGQNGT